MATTPDNAEGILGLAANRSEPRSSHGLKAKTNIWKGVTPCREPCVPAASLPLVPLRSSQRNAGDDLMFRGIAQRSANGRKIAAFRPCIYSHRRTGNARGTEVLQWFNPSADFPAALEQNARPRSTALLKEHK